MGAWIADIVGLGIGAAIAWIVARSRGRTELARAEALAATRRVAGGCGEEVDLFHLSLRWVCAVAM